MLEIEFEDPISEICDCCGNEIVRLTRFVYKNNNAFAIYYITFTKNHSEKEAIGLISIGDWGSDKRPVNRFSFPFKIWTHNLKYQIGLINKNESKWKDKILGHILDREEALEHPWIKDVFHITDHIVTEDKEVVNYFNLNQ